MVEICPCSPDTGDCPRCKKGGGLDKMGDCSGGKRRKTARKWIQEVVKNMKKGAFTKQALKQGETPEEYAADVLQRPKKHTLKTRRRAQFLMNIKKRSTTRKLVHATRKSRK
jgi:hypothetical protein